MNTNTALFNDINSELVGEYISVFDSMQDMYEASTQDDFKGVGLLRKKYTKETLDQDIRHVTDYFDDGTFDAIREIKVNPNQFHSIAETTKAHPLHTDATFSKLSLERFILSFIKVDQNDFGGASEFFPIHWILSAIPDRYRQALERSVIAYKRCSMTEGNKSYQGPLLSWINENRPVFRWRYDLKVKPTVVDAKNLPISDAIEWVKNYIDAVQPIVYRASPGETLLIDNGKVLHGRTSLKSKSERLALRAWIK